MVPLSSSTQEIQSMVVEWTLYYLDPVPWCALCRRLADRHLTRITSPSNLHYNDGLRIASSLSTDRSMP